MLRAKRWMTIYLLFTIYNLFKKGDCWGAALVNYWNAGMPGKKSARHRHFYVTLRLFLKQPDFFWLDRPNSLVGPSKRGRETSRRAPGVAPGTEGIWSIYKSINNPPTSIKTLSVIFIVSNIQRNHPTDCFSLPAICAICKQRTACHILYCLQRYIHCNNIAALLTFISYSIICVHSYVRYSVPCRL